MAQDPCAAEHPCRKLPPCTPKSHPHAAFPDLPIRGIVNNLQSPVFEDGGNTYLILRPGRFGKTLMMNTLCRKFRRMQESPVIADANKQEFCDTASRSMTGNAR